MLSIFKASPKIEPKISLGRDFCQNGFVRIREVFSRKEIAAMRTAAIGILPPNAPPYQPQFSDTVFFHEPFRQILRNARLTEGLRTLLGEDFLFLNEFSLHDSHFSGWHTDTTSPEAKAGHEFHWSPTYLVLNAAIYLQDNDGSGGGLDVVPKSHLHDDPLAITMRGGQVSNSYESAITIESKAGDVVIFHLRMSHRASEVKRVARSDAERKLAFFMIAGANNASTRRYREWLDQYDKMNNVTRPAIPEDFQTFLSGGGLQII
jgi:hypothetical protein